MVRIQKNRFLFDKKKYFVFLRCDICKQCFRKRKAIICVSEFDIKEILLNKFLFEKHFETSEKHENNLKHLPPYRRAVQYVSISIHFILIFYFFYFIEFIY